ncbi:MAG: hypothetical protein C4542_07995 [Dehalococcoidia bacterium]|nr:MAG: hypothetical protein C4542_07995 [Dehalococcoidia bacterium]
MRIIIEIPPSNVRFPVETSEFKIIKKSKSSYGETASSDELSLVGEVTGVYLETADNTPS